MEIPNTPEDMTPEWLTQALRQTSTITHANVLSFQTQAVGAEGEGITGQVARVNLDYDIEEPAAPKTLIAKFHSNAIQARTVINSLGMYEKEHLFYQHGAGKAGLSTPKCYYSDYQTNGTTVLLLEDMTPARSIGSELSPTQLEMVIQQMSSFHAYWWEHPRLTDILGPDDPDGVRSTSLRVQEVVQAKWELVVKLAGDNLPDPMRTIGQRIVNNLSSIGANLFTSPPLTLIHGDMSGDNLLFTTSEGDQPFTVIDWQLCKRGRGTYDIGSLLGTLPPEQRRKSEMSLLEMYHQILVESGVSGYSFEQCLSDYRLTALQQFANLFFVIREPNPGEDLKLFQATDHKFREVRLPRVCATILDLDADKLIKK